MFQWPWFWIVVLLTALVLLPQVVSIAIRYVVVPIRLRRMNLILPIEKTAVPIELTQLPAVASQGFFTAARDLAGFGFVAAGHLQFSEPMRDSDAFKSAWINRQSGDVAVIGWVSVRRGGRESRGEVVMFLTEFGDGAKLLTSNREDGGATIPDPNVSALACPGASVASLYELHRVRKQRFALEGLARQPTLPEAGGEIDHFVMEATRRVMDRQVRGGRYQWDEPAGAYRLTWKGAYLLAWKFMWPWKQIAEAKREREREAEMRRLGLGSVRSFLAQAQTNVASTSHE